MSAWRPIKTAPRNGTRVMVRTDEGAELEASWNADGYEDEDGACGGWEAAHEDKHPDCWSDGVCWGSNANGVPSDQPRFWRPLVRSIPTSAVPTDGAMKRQEGLAVTEPLQPKSSTP